MSYFFSFLYRVLQSDESVESTTLLASQCLLKIAEELPSALLPHLLDFLALAIRLFEKASSRRNMDVTMNSDNNTALGLFYSAIFMAFSVAEKSLLRQAFGQVLTSAFTDLSMLSLLSSAMAHFKPTTSHDDMMHELLTQLLANPSPILSTPQRYKVRQHACPHV